MSGERKYLIIGGSTKCGTTSVFSYFQFHPQVCACKQKESRYFLESDYLILAKGRNHSRVNSFEDLFPACGDDLVRLEATPDYLYSVEALQRIKKEIPGVKLVFILRDPVDRLISWYRFARQNGMVDTDTGFDQFVAEQVRDADVKNAPQHLMALPHGKYSSYLQPYINSLGKDNIHIAFFEELSKDPKSFCSDICSFAGLDFNYFSDYKFKIHNPSGEVKSVTAHLRLRSLKRAIRPITRIFSGNIRKRIKLAGRGIENSLRKMNEENEITGFMLNNDIHEQLKAFYRDEINIIVKLTGRIPDWKYLKES